MPTPYVNPNKDYYTKQQLSVTGYKDNPDGTTTNYLSDGSTDTGTYSKNSDGSLNFNAITSASLAQTPSLAYKQPEQVPIYPVGKMEIPALEMTEPEKQADSFSSKLQELNNSLVGESAYRAQQEQQADILGKKQTLNDLTSRLTSLKNEALAIPQQLQLQAEGRGITAGGLRPIETAALRNNAIQALSTNSLLQAAQGNLTTALDMVDRAVAQKYDPIREEIAAKTANLNLILNSPSYTLAEKNRAQKQQLALEDRKLRLAQEEEDEKEVKAIAVDAAKNGADAITLKQIAEASTPADALAVAAKAGLLNETSYQFTTLTSEDAYGNKTQRIVALDPRTGKQFTVSSNPVNGTPVSTTSPTGSTTAPIPYSPVTGGGGTKFTSTQINKGANNAGMTVEEFKGLSPDVKNYYVNSTDTQLSAVQQEFDAIKTGKKPYGEVVSLIENSNSPDPVKEHLKLKAGLIKAPPLKKGFFAKSWDGVRSFLGI